jgi:GntR family transcriptional regulator
MSSLATVSPKSRALEGILFYIEDHELSAGDKLPAEREFCHIIGVSRTALRAAIAALTSRHILESRPGAGTYIMPTCPTDVMQETYSFSDSVRAVGMVPGSRLIYARVEMLGPELVDRMEVPECSRAFHLCRVRLVNSRPVSIEKTYVNYALCPGIETHNFTFESLYQVLQENYGVRVEHGREKVTVGYLSEEEAHFLEADSGEPVLVRDGLELNPLGVTVELVHSIILPSRYKLAAITYNH